MLSYFVRTTVKETFASEVALVEVGVIAPVAPPDTPKRMYAAPPPANVTDNGVAAPSVRVRSGYGGGGLLVLTSLGMIERKCQLGC